MDINITNKNGIILNTRNKVCEDDININIDNSQEILPENIAKDVTILGVTGSLEPSNIDQLISGEITTLNIPNKTTKIRDSAFQNCPKLTSITIPNSVTSIGISAFYNCSSLTSITIPDNVTRIGNSAFRNCTSLTSITIPDSVTSISDETFWSCSNLTSITIPDNVTNIGNNAFRGCTNLTSITIPDSVTSIGSRTFYNCPSLTSINIPNSVTSIGDYAFNYSGLIDVVIENGFNANNLDLSASTKYTHDTILSWLNALYDRTGLDAYKLVIGSTNLQKLTDEEKAIATAKNWTLA